MRLTTMWISFDELSINHIPDKPSAYELSNVRQNIVYIGSTSKSLRGVLLSHLQDPRFSSVWYFRFKSVSDPNKASEIQHKLCMQFKKQNKDKLPKLQKYELICSANSYPERSVMSKRERTYPSVEDVQRRVANTSIGASTLRSQGVRIKEAREFLEGLNLDELIQLPKEDFNDWLGKKTKLLMRRFKCNSGDKNNWGAARKVINIFLENALHNRFLFEEYNLQRFEDVLEIPLDSNVAKGLEEDWKKYLERHKSGASSDKLPKWTTIKGLEPTDSDKFQACARKVADAIPNYRYSIYLDLKYWRKKKLLDE